MPLVTTVDLDGSEDFMILASGGLWDVVSAEQAATAVFNEIKEEHQGRLHCFCAL